MTTADTDVQELLARSIPDRQSSALERVRSLAKQMQFLSWTDRARLFDEMFWSEARAMLSSDAVTAIVNRHVDTFRPGSPGQLYTAYCAPITTGVLLLLNEPAEIDCVEQALTCLLSRRAEHQQSAVDWIARTRCGDLQPALSALPGYAFMFLTSCPNDTAESFMARDAFWSAMLGR